MNRHLTPQDPTPSALGFAMPAEWAGHAATWMSWPADDELWFGHLPAVRAEYAELVRTIVRFEPVELLVRDDESEQDARRRLGDLAQLRYHRVALDDVWIRDNGPIFVRQDQPDAPGPLALTNWKFNSWGGKFEWRHDDLVPEYVAGQLGMGHWDLPVVLEGGAVEVNGEGVALVTRSCLLTPTRNPQLSEADYARLLGDYLGAERVLWLDGGLENDHTDGHIDTITRFTDAQTIVTSVAEDPADANFAPMQANLARLREMRDGQDRPFRVVELPLPAVRLEGAEGRLPPTYANFYIGNGFVVVPLYGDPNDERALEVLRPLFPGREVIGLMSRAIIEGGGSFHCMTQQQPEGDVWPGP
ncbi:agmatine deiminase family protein [Deinococcus sonorensis]|uniref:Agmatine deiminase family protein n=2 Tax=Deinococcus sonorensis TaxID=309891 RepID=A0AAU7UB75_9DEIO